MPQSLKTPDPSSGIEEAVTRYINLRPTYEQFAERLHSLFQNLMEIEQIGYQTIERRSKSIESFQGKLLRPGKSYADPFTQVPDLAGLRVIVYFDRDVERVAALIDRELDVDPLSSSDKRSELAPDQFGYLSVHKVARIGSSRGNLPEWRHFRDCLVEIQVRTVLQHAWAAISHKLQYKREAEVPIEFRRRLIRLAGLLELADEEFGALGTTEAELRDEISVRIAERDPAVELNSLSIEEYLNSDIIIRIRNAATNAGLTLSELDLSEGSQLLMIGQALDIRTTGELTTELTRIAEKAEEFFKELLRYGKSIGGNEDYFAAAILVGKNHTKISEEVIVPPWSPTHWPKVVEAGNAVFLSK